MNRPADAQVPSPAVREPLPLPDRERRSPLLRWTVHVGLPGALSLTLHALLAVVLALAGRVLLEGSAAAPEPLAVQIRPLADPAVNLFDWPGTRRLDELEIHPPRAAAGEIPDLRALARSETLRIGPDEQDAGPSSGGLGLGAAGEIGLLGTGGGARAGGGGGLGAGLGSGQRAGQAGMWGLNVAARRVCYVIDFSGSMVVVHPELVRELKRSVGQLVPPQEFNVILFYQRGGRYVAEAFASALQPARPPVKRQFFAWIDERSPNGPTRPLVAVERALAMGPDVIFFFSDGDFEDQVVERITETNGMRTRIHCLYFNERLLADRGGLPPRLDDTGWRMAAIAERNGGRLKVLTGADLER